MNHSWKKNLFNFSLIIIFTVLVLYFALKDQFETVTNLILNINPIWLFIILIWGIGYGCVVGWILMVFGKKYRKDYSLLQGIGTAFVGIFFSGITPSATGGQFAQAYIFHKQGIKYSDGASILWADFIVYQTTMMLYVTILFFLRYHHFMRLLGAWIYVILAGYFINVCVIAALWTMALFPNVYIKLSHVALSFLHRIHLVKDKEATKKNWDNQLNSFTVEIKKLQKDKVLILKTVALNVLRMTVQFSLPFFISMALQSNIHASAFLDCLALSSFVLMANSFIPIPGASGGTELVFVAVFQTILASEVIASSVMILWRFSTFHFVMIVGGLMFIILKRYYDLHRNQVEEEELCELA